VDVGDILSSMIGSGSIPCTRLTEFYRTDKLSTITPNAHLINQGELPDLYAKSNDFHWIDTKDDSETNRAIKNIVENNLIKEAKANPDDIQILSPQYQGDAGVNSLNSVMCDIINPRTPQKFKQPVYGTDYYVGDRVMQMKNNKELKVSNGEIGKISYFDLSNKRNKRVKIDFEGRTVDMPLRSLGDMTHAYATTIHKSQGSEYPIIIIPISKRHVRSLSRQLVYTGVTRGKAQVFLVGDKQALEDSLKNSQKTKRYTQLSALLKMGLPQLNMLV
jgi:exodeoxyribonuclease V alpha subunit